MNKKEQDKIIINEFIIYLESDDEKFKFDKKHMMNPYSYSNEIMDFMVYWNNSRFLRNKYLKKYKSYKNFREEALENRDITYLLNVITYIIRFERFASGLIAFNLDKLNKALKILISRYKEIDKYLE